MCATVKFWNNGMRKATRTQRPQTQPARFLSCVGFGRLCFADKLLCWAHCSSVETFFRYQYYSNMRRAKKIENDIVIIEEPVFVGRKSLVSLKNTDTNKRIRSSN